MEQNIVKGFLKNSSAVLKHLLKKDKYKSEMITSVGKYIKDEVNNLCKLRESLLKTTSETISNDMASFEWTKIAFFNGCMKANSHQVLLVWVTAVSVLLYSQSQNIYLIQMLFGIVFVWQKRWVLFCFNDIIPIKNQWIIGVKLFAFIYILIYIFIKSLTCWHK